MEVCDEGARLNRWPAGRADRVDHLFGPVAEQTGLIISLVRLLRCASSGVPRAPALHSGRAGRRAPSTRAAGASASAAYHGTKEMTQPCLIHLHVIYLVAWCE